MANPDKIVPFNTRDMGRLVSDLKDANINRGVFIGIDAEGQVRCSFTGCYRPELIGLLEMAKQEIYHCDD